MHPVRVGTCGLSYKEWSGVFYPKGVAAGDFLSYRPDRQRLLSAPTPPMVRP
jgi:uncharacterized protein YecE (DUF72 family)